jgi:hypothetical protein
MREVHGWIDASSVQVDRCCVSPASAPQDDHDVAPPLQMGNARQRLLLRFLQRKATWLGYVLCMVVEQCIVTQIPTPLTRGNHIGQTISDQRAHTRLLERLADLEQIPDTWRCLASVALAAAFVTAPACTGTS